MKVSHIIKLDEFLPYFFIGGATTLIDWSTFWVFIACLHTHYLAALCVAYGTAGIFHYTANKLITFKCQSKQIGTQYSIYIVLTVASLFLSMGIIALFIKFFSLDAMTARILTTLLMLVPNYLLHKHITFSKKIFIQPEL